MKRSELKAGMEVFIDRECVKTNSVHTLVPEMKKIRGTIQTIDEVSDWSIHIGGWNWHADDMHHTPIESFSIHESQIPKNIKPFDPNELVLGE